MAEEQAENSEEKRKGVPEYGVFPCGRIGKKSAAECKEKEANQETAGRAEEFAETAGKIRKYRNAEKTEQKVNQIGK